MFSRAGSIGSRLVTALIRSARLTLGSAPAGTPIMSVVFPTTGGAQVVDAQGQVSNLVASADLAGFWATNATAITGADINIGGTVSIGGVPVQGALVDLTIFSGFNLAIDHATFGTVRYVQGDTTVSLTLRFLTDNNGKFGVLLHGTAGDNVTATATILAPLSGDTFAPAPVTLIV